MFYGENAYNGSVLELYDTARRLPAGNQEEK